MVDQGVVRRFQAEICCRAAILGPVDDILGMFDTHADGKGLLFQGNALVVEHVIRIAGTMADTHDDQLGRIFIAVIDGHRSNAAFIVAMDGRDAAGKMDFPAPGFDGMTHILDYAAQDIGPDMGIIGIQDILRCAGIDKSLQDAPQQRMIDAGRQFAIRKGPGPTFAELDIRRGLERTATPKSFYIFRPGIDIAAPFKDDRRVAVFRQGQGSCQAGWAGPDDDRPMRHRLCTGMDFRRWRLGQTTDILIIPAAFPHPVFVGKRNVDSEDEINPRLPPGINGPADNGKAGNIAAAASKLFSH